MFVALTSCLNVDDKSVVHSTKNRPVTLVNDNLEEMSLVSNGKELDTFLIYYEDQINGRHRTVGFWSDSGKQFVQDFTRSRIAEQKKSSVLSFSLLNLDLIRNAENEQLIMVDHYRLVRFIIRVNGTRISKEFRDDPNDESDNRGFILDTMMKMARMEAPYVE